MSDYQIKYLIDKYILDFLAENRVVFLNSLKKDIQIQGNIDFNIPHDIFCKKLGTNTYVLYNYNDNDLDFEDIYSQVDVFELYKKIKELLSLIIFSMLYGDEDLSLQYNGKLYCKLTSFFKKYIEEYSLMKDVINYVIYSFLNDKENVIKIENYGYRTINVLLQNNAIFKNGLSDFNLSQ